MPGGEFDVIIVGAGVTGLGVAYRLGKRGKRVCVIEQSAELQNPRNGSHGDSRIIRMLNRSDIYSTMSWENYDHWRALEYEVGVKLFELNGLLWLSDDKETYERAEVMRKAAAPFEVFNSIQLCRRYPHLNYDKNWWGILDHMGGTMFARRCLSALYSSARNSGVHFEFGRQVAKWEVKGPTKVEIQTTDGHKWISKNLVLTVGSWLRQMAPEIPVKVEPVCIPVFFWDYDSKQSDLFALDKRSPNIVMSDNERNEEVFLIPDADYPGKVKFAVHGGEIFDVDGEIPQSVVNNNLRLSTRHLREHIRYVDSSKPSIQTTCLYGNTGDGTFILDRHPEYGNVIIISGCCGTGFKFAPTFGDIVADIVDNRKPRHDIRPFSAKRSAKPAGERCKL